MLLGGSWVVISRVTIVITHMRGLVTPLTTTHEPPNSWMCCVRALPYLMLGLGSALEY